MVLTLFIFLNFFLYINTIKNTIKLTQDSYRACLKFQILPQVLEIIYYDRINPKFLPSVCHWSQVFNIQFYSLNFIFWIQLYIGTAVSNLALRGKPKLRTKCKQCKIHRYFIKFFNTLLYVWVAPEMVWIYKCLQQNFSTIPMIYCRT